MRVCRAGAAGQDKCPLAGQARQDKTGARVLGRRGRTGPHVSNSSKCSPVPMAITCMAWQLRNCNCNCNRAIAMPTPTPTPQQACEHGGQDRAGADQAGGTDQADQVRGGGGIRRRQLQGRRWEDLVDALCAIRK